MKVIDCKPGLRVWYHPVIGDSLRFAGTIRERPWRLGSGHWVTHLCDMDAAYGAWLKSPRAHVHGAWIDALETVGAS